MLVTSLALLSLAVGLGSLLLAGRARRGAIIHGVAGGAGLGVLAVAWRAGVPHGPVGWDVLGLLVAALAGGLCLATVWRRGRRPGLAVFLHAMAGGLAYLLLAGFMLG